MSSTSLLHRSTHLYRSVRPTITLRSATTTHTTHITPPTTAQLQLTHRRSFSSHSSPSSTSSSSHSTSTADDDIHFHPPSDMLNAHLGTALFSLMWFWVFVNWWESWDVFFGLRHPFMHRGEKHDDAGDDDVKHPI